MIVRLSDLAPGDEGDFFALLSAKEELTTREGKPYFRVAFRDAEREVTFPIWQDGVWADDCKEHWQTGQFYKLRATYRETTYGPQLDIRRIRKASDADAGDGFDPLMLRPRSPFDTEEMYARTLALIERHVTGESLRAAVLDVWTTYRERICTWPASRRHHHTYVGGFLEHALSVVETSLYLVEKYSLLYPDLKPPIRADIVVVGALLHDIGKLVELDPRPAETHYSAAGHLLGHVLLGFEIVRTAAQRHDVDLETRLRVEHILAAHERRADWGAARPPLTLEALLVQSADDLDAQFHLFVQCLGSDRTVGPFTGNRNGVGRELFRGFSQAMQTNQPS